MKKLNASTSKLSVKHQNLAELLISLHQDESPYTELPKYEFDQLKKGITCKECHSFSIFLNERKISCNDCGFEEGIESAVMRSVSELKLLFPNKKISTNVVCEWCQVGISKARLSRILKKNLNAIGYGQWSYYE